MREKVIAITPRIYKKQNTMIARLARSFKCSKSEVVRRAIEALFYETEKSKV